MNHFIKETLYHLYLQINCHIHERKRWHDANALDCNLPKVYYGYGYIPKRNEPASGGIVKIQDLLPVFPNCLIAPNILYLVSSALPQCVLVIIKYAKKCGCRVVLNQNGTAFKGWYGKGWESANQSMRAVLEAADYVFYQSEFCKLAADLHLSTRHDNFEILYNPVDTGFFIPFEKENNKFNLLLAGSHHQFYRVKTAVDTVRLLISSFPEIRLTIAGKYRWRKSEQQSKDELIDYIGKQGVSKNIELKGAYSQHEAAELIGRHHLLLHTKYNDPCPRLVVEALSCGLPVVYSESGGVPELVGKDAGVGVPAPKDWEKLHPPNPEHMDKAVISIMNNYNGYSNNARKRALTLFDVRPWLERHREIFLNLL